MEVEVVAGEGLQWPSKKGVKTGLRVSPAVGHPITH